MQDVIEYLYPEIKPKDIITAKKYGRYAKTDLVVSVRNKKRGISIKSGHKNSIHIEPLKNFTDFLIKNNVEYPIIEIFNRYIYSDGTNNNTGIKRITNAEYIDRYPENMAKINICLDNLSEKLVRRFLIETDIKYQVLPAVFIHGEINDFVWATAEEVQEFLKSEKISSTSAHTGKLYIQCWDKNLKYNEKYEYCRNYIQVKWFSLYDDIISIMSKRYNK